LPEEWKTPDFIKLSKSKPTGLVLTLKMRSGNMTNSTIIKYEQYKRNKAAISLMWDMNARPHEITLLKIKYMRLK
jgi:integrase/recombinase XerD